MHNLQNANKGELNIKVAIISGLTTVNKENWETVTVTHFYKHTPLKAYKDGKTMLVQNQLILNKTAGLLFLVLKPFDWEVKCLPVTKKHASSWLLFKLLG